MIKKNLVPCILAALLICAVFTACSNRSSGSSSSTVSGGSSSSAGSSSGSTSSGGSSSGESASGSGSSGDASGGSAMPDSSAGGAGTGTGEGMEISAFSDTLREVYGDKYYPDTEMSDDEIRDELGLTDDLYEEVYAEGTAQKAHPDTFIAVRVKDGQTEAVKERLEAYKEKLKGNEDFAANADKLDAAQIYSEGDYVFFVLLGDVEENESSGGMAEAFGREVQKGVDAIKSALGMDA